jgi:protein-tyrosine phosphatase
MLAAFLVSQGLGADAAIDRIRDLRPGSIEVYGQERVVHQYADRLEKN